MSDLDRQVAEALGQAVCGGEARGSKEPWGPARCDRCGAEHDFGPEWPAGFPRILHLPPPPYSTSWEASGRLCEEMRRRGYGFGVRSLKDGPDEPVWAEFQRGEDAEGYPVVRGYAHAPTFPAAVAAAALRALGERGEG
jgi:hypothetical protein